MLGKGFAFMNKGDSEVHCTVSLMIETDVFLKSKTSLKKRVSALSILLITVKRCFSAKYIMPCFSPPRLSQISLTFKSKQQKNCYY